MIPEALSEDGRSVMRQSLAGMLWSKQYYHYVVKRWLEGDPGEPPPPPERLHGRNHEWKHLFNADVISMPDKWEYPWYAAWDLAFHMVPLALVDSEFAKDQLTLMLREWYMHPNGQLPAYEWALGDVNPPVHAWAAWRVYKIEKKRRGVGDRQFLERVFQKLLLNFTWWVNRKDASGSNVFEGGFLGLDNIGVFDRSQPLPTGGTLQQSDATSWMAMYSLNLLAMAMELAHDNPAYEDLASKFWEHFVYIGHAMGYQGKNKGLDLWDDQDGFFYDCLRFDDGTRFPLKVRSMVGLIPLFAVETLEPEMLDRLPGFKRRLEWFVEHRHDLTDHVACMRTPGDKDRRLLSVVTAERLQRVLHYMLDEEEFLSPYGIRALSRYHKDRPYLLGVDGHEHRVDYEPGESASGLFGGNSNWRGPIWFPRELPADRVAAEVPPLLRRRREGGMPDRLGTDADAGRGGHGAVTPAVVPLPARSRRPAPGVWRRGALSAGPELARPGAIPRVFPRRHRPRRRREPSDGVDRAGGQAPPAERGLMTLDFT